MNIYDRIIDNPLFFKWIFHPSAEIDAYWRHFLETNPEYAEKITELKLQIEVHLKYEDKKLSDVEKKAIARRIVHQLDLADRKLLRFRIIHGFMRYAAVGLIFLLLGGGLVFWYFESRQLQVNNDHLNLPAQLNEPLLIIGDSEKIALNQGESQLEYSPRGDIILNNDQTIREQSGDKLPEMNTLVIPYGNRSVITLSDGSMVWLNAGSRLIYPTRFVDKTREVFLIGEAFFDIRTDKTKPFVVKTTDVFIEAIGTRFNVCAYPEDYSVQTVLAEGSVSVRKVGSGRGEKGTILKPGYLAYFNKKTQETQTQLVNLDHYILWTQGLFCFSNTEFNRITKKLERYYNIRFQFDDPLKGIIEVSGKLDVTKDRTEVFLYLERLTGLTFIQINEKHYVIK
ncbi:MAG: FecR domain-containing protein [Mariniphaga sp.]|nr:FecR domain-containing protein [Mariniphaga sp.]MDD4227412.1 FecR domain-containing protein [Mariniphaga sp.]MDD4425068.1 FecR domain-containing protein [Mariniphaga sp.]